MLGRLGSQIENLASDGTFEPIWTHETFRRDAFAKPILERSSSPSLITTRIDSDDAIARDYLASVQAQFGYQERLFVNFARGVQIDRSGAVYRRDQFSGPFQSLIEWRTDEPPLTVYGPKHAKSRSMGPLLEVKAPSMWIQVIHELNWLNIVSGSHIDPGEASERFDISIPFDGALLTPVMRARDSQGLIERRAVDRRAGRSCEIARETGVREAILRSAGPGVRKVGTR